MGNSKILLNASGQAGDDAIDGLHGSDGMCAGSDGSDGADATEPTEGQDAQNFITTLDTEEDADEGQKVVLRTQYGRYSQEFDTPLKIALNKFGDIVWSARGGRGGNGGTGGNGGSGATGTKGRDATSYTWGGDGGKGGDGGNGGYGTSGKDGGRGGHVLFVASEVDTYLFMAVTHADNQAATTQLVQGGAAGFPGRHGVAGLGGEGGRGGNSYTYYTTTTRTVYARNGATTVQDREAHTMPGGWHGKKGKPGFAPVTPLYQGRPGEDGSFALGIKQQNGSIVKYGGRYDLRLSHFAVVSWGFPQDPMLMEFGDTVTLTNIAVKNVGLMPSPVQQRVMIELDGTASSLVRPIQSSRAFLPMCLNKNELGTAQGKLQFNVPIPDTESAGDDFDEVVQQGALCLMATQLGPERAGASAQKAEFQRRYDSFQRATAFTVTAKFPVRNTQGVSGLKSLAPGEKTMLKFQIENTGAHDLGAEADLPSRRVLAVRFYLNQSKEYGIPPEYVRLETSGRSEPDFRLGHFIEIPLLKRGDTAEVSRTLSLSKNVDPYSRLAIQADILIQHLPAGTEYGSGCDNLVQRRKLVIVSEPAYEHVHHAEVVLVESTSTRQSVHERLLGDVLRKQFGFVTESFPVSRYGTLDPDFRLPGTGSSLKEVLKNKLVIVLNQPFELLGNAAETVRPTQLLPGGCMCECSGFHSSTRWLIIDSDLDCNEQLLNVHSSRSNIKTVTETAEHESPRAFFKYYEDLLKAERDSGSELKFHPSIRCDSVSVPLRGSSDEKALISRVQKKAESIRSWLGKEDPLHQYLIEYTALKMNPPTGYILVRRGAFWPSNEVIVVEADSDALNSSTVMSSKAMLFAIAQALPTHLRTIAFGRVLRQEPSATRTQVVLALTDSFTSHFLWEIANLFDDLSHIASLKECLNDKTDFVFPTVASLRTSTVMKGLVRDASAQESLKHRVEKEIAVLLAHLESVANSKDLKPTWVPLSAERKVSKALTAMVNELKIEWKPILDGEVEKKERKDLEKLVLDYIRKDRGKLRLKTHQRWRKGLNYLHSTSNTSKYENDGGLALNVTRLIECDDSHSSTHQSMRIKLPEKKTLSTLEGNQLRGKYRSTTELAANVYDDLQRGRKELFA